MTKRIEVKPHERRKGWLKNDNPPGDFSKAPRCGAKTRKGTPCLSPAMKNGRCRLHGGKSTGPRTSEGIERIRATHLKHGEYTKKAIEERKQFYSLLRQLKETERALSEKGKRINIKL
jgi:hypothetical protein